MATRWGTCYFVDIVAARRYYIRQGFNARDVDRKIEKKEIHVGELPTVPAGGRRFLDADERWNIEVADSPQQNNCDGSGPHNLGEVRLMPTGGDGNLILCRSCWNREIAYRRDRNRSLGQFAQFDLPEFDVAKEYETS